MSNLHDDMQKTEEGCGSVLAFLIADLPAILVGLVILGVAVLLFGPILLPILLPVGLWYGIKALAKPRK